MVKFAHFISKETENNKCYLRTVEHSKGTQRALEHSRDSDSIASCGNQALEGSLGTQILERESDTRAVRHSRDWRNFIWQTHSF